MEFISYKTNLYKIVSVKYAITEDYSDLAKDLEKVASNDTYLNHAKALARTDVSGHHHDCPLHALH